MEVQRTGNINRLTNDSRRAAVNSKYLGETHDLQVYRFSEVFVMAASECSDDRFCLPKTRPDNKDFRQYRKMPHDLRIMLHRIGKKIWGNGIRCHGFLGLNCGVLREGSGIQIEWDRKLLALKPLTGAGPAISPSPESKQQNGKVWHCFFTFIRKFSSGVCPYRKICTENKPVEPETDHAGEGRKKIFVPRFMRGAFL